MDLITQLSEIYDPYSFLPSKKHGFALCSYDKMRSNEGQTRSFILDYIPANCIPDEFIQESRYIDMIVTCFELLCLNPNDIYEDMDTFMYSSIIEMIHAGKLQPHQEFIDLLPTKNIDDAIDNFNKYLVLYRFFKNKGRVFYNNDMQLIDLRVAKYLNKETPMTRYFYELENEEVLRRAKDSELAMLLATYSKAELGEVFRMVKPLSKLNINNLSKREIIKEVFNSGDEIQTELVKLFFTLNDNYQNFKIWMAMERTYFRVYSLFYKSIETSLRELGSVMRELIDSHNDYLTANKLGQLYFEVKNSMDQIAFIGEDNGEVTVTKLNARIEEFFKNRTPIN